MKKFTILFSACFLLSIPAVFSQRPVIALTFTAEYNNLHVPLDSILIQNLTQPGDTMLFAPDTVLSLDYVSGVPDYPETAKSSFSVSPNYPNPSVDGKTSIDVFIPAREIVTMRVFDIIGNEVAFYENTLDAGNHHFTFLAGKEKYYVLSVYCGNEIRSVKMINSGNSNQMQGTLIYQGSTETEPPMKSQEAITGFDFSLGDELQYTAFASGYQASIIVDIPESNKTYVFEMVSSVFTCGSSFTINHVTGDVAPVNKTVTYGTVTNIPGEETKCWITSNLGADHQATAVNDATEPSAGWYWQFNRKQGFKHTGTVRTPNTPWITTISENSDWLPANDPCTLELGAGWRLPTSTEWTNVDVSGNWTNWNGPWDSGLKLHAAGQLIPASGALNLRGVHGRYRSGTQSTADWGWNLIFGDTWCFIYDDDKEGGNTARCLRETGTASLPTVNTAAITDITQTTATGGGEVTDDGGSEVTARGVCWSTSQNPTIADSHTSDGTGTGVFVSNLTNLTPNTPYFVRAYATNSVGTAYGNDVNFVTTSSLFTCGDIVTYEGQNYNTIVMGTQCWFLENLNVGTMVTQNQTNNGVIEKYCYNDDPANCEIYGGLYDWGEVMQYSTQPGIQAICPTGWHIPTNEEFTTFTDYISSQPAYFCDNSGFNNAKAIATNTGWDSSSEYCAVGNDQSSNNASGFSGMPVGMRMDNGSGFSGVGNTTAWYSSTESSSFASFGRMIAADYWFILSSMMSKSYGLSVRCLKNETSANIPTVTTSGITDITQATATGGGEVTDDGGADIIARGVCWSTSQNPTITDSHTSDGTGIGTFVSNLTELTPNTPYFARAYATNSVGTAYGNEVNFTTLSAGFVCGSTFTINHITGEVAPVNKTVTYGTVTNIPGEPSKCWITSNLGSDHQATAKDDATEASAGWYWQFNRKQGYKHTGTVRTPNTTWITSINENSDWLVANDPCTIELGSGWRIPTHTEWTNVHASGNWTNWNGPWNSGLKMHAAGVLSHQDGSVYGRGSFGNYWSSTQCDYPEGGWELLFYSVGSEIRDQGKANAESIRCISEASASTMPTVSTSQVIDITQTTATSGGNVTADGGALVTDRGVCWSTTQNPTITDSHTSDGTGTGAFVSNLTNLTPNTPYFVRAYATNSVGTAYGNEESFTTLPAGFVCGSTLTINHVTGEIAPVNKTVTYGTVTNIPGETSKCWITSNLGADHQATAKDDDTEASAGWYWQFNRKQGYKHDGVTLTPNTTWITSINENLNWTAANDPCTIELGTGWRIPIKTEWTNVDASGGWTDWNGPWNSSLKMHAAGCLSGSDGSLFGRGAIGYYWSSVQDGTTAGWHLVFTSTESSINAWPLKSNGFPLRCIKQ